MRVYSINSYKLKNNSVDYDLSALPFTAKADTTGKTMRSTGLKLAKIIKNWFSNKKTRLLTRISALTRQEVFDGFVTTYNLKGQKLKNVYSANDEFLSKIEKFDYHGNIIFERKVLHNGKIETAKKNVIDNVVRKEILYPNGSRRLIYDSPKIHSDKLYGSFGEIIDGMSQEFTYLSEDKKIYIVKEYNKNNKFWRVKYINENNNERRELILNKKTKLVEVERQFNNGEFAHERIFDWNSKTYTINDYKKQHLYSKSERYDIYQDSNVNDEFLRPYIMRGKD